MSRVVVIGAGLAGLTAARRLAEAGRAVTLVSLGLGGLPLSQGTIDVLGYLPGAGSAGLGGPVPRPLEAIDRLVPDHPEHPYAAIGRASVRRGVEFLARVLGHDYLVGDPETNVLLPTAVGAARPTCLVPPSMAAGACVVGARFLIVGLSRLKDFPAALVAGNLSRIALPDGGRIQARAVTVDVPVRSDVADTSGLMYARALDDAGLRARLAAAIAPLVEPGEAVGLPAILGLRDVTAWRDVADRLGHPVFEIPLPPPSVPGLRLNDALTRAAKAAGVRVILGSRAHPVERGASGHLGFVQIDSAGSPTRLEAEAFVLATGGFESGALTLDPDGHVRETVFDLPLAGVPEDPDALVHDRFWGADQPLFAVGVRTDERMRPVDPGGGVVYDNLYAAGGLLAGAQRWTEKSGDGIALGSAVAAADAITEVAA